MPSRPVSHFTVAADLHILLRVCLLLIAVSFSLTVDGQARTKEYPYAVRGRVVDSFGRAVPSAQILISPEPDDTGGDFSYAAVADQSGRFYIQVDKSAMNRVSRVLKVTGPDIPSTVRLIEPGFEPFSIEQVPTFPGQRVRIEPNGEIDLGDVTVQIWYGSIRLVLRDKFDNPLLHNLDDWRRLWLIVRDKKGNKLVESGLSARDVEQAANFADSSLMIALPVGKWRVEVSTNQDRGPYLTSSSPVTLVQCSGNSALKIVQ